MQNDDYYELVRSEWEKILGQNIPIVTEAERDELHDLMEKQKAHNGGGLNNGRTE